MRMGYNQAPDYGSTKRGGRSGKSYKNIIAMEYASERD